MAKKDEKSRMKSRKVRFKTEEMGRIQMLADLYAGGNFSKWVRYAAINCSRKVLVSNED